MQNNQNLWIGLLIGSGLTGLLMYLLSQQANPFDTASPTTKTPTMTAPFVKPETSVATKTKSIQSETAEPQITQTKPMETGTTKKIVASQQVKTVPVQTPLKQQNIDLPGIPENPRLPEEELAKLSPEERKKYEETLMTYQQVRDKVLNLHQEREQLEQQIKRIIEENTIIDQQLDKIRQDQKDN